MIIPRLLSPDVALADAPAATPPPEPQFGLDVMRKELNIQRVVPEPAKRPTERSPEMTPENPTGKPAEPRKEAIAKPTEPSKETLKEPNAPDDPEAFMNSLSGKSKARFVELANKYGEKVAEEKMKSAKLLTPEIEAKMTDYEKKNAELLTELRQLGVERSPEYMQKFVERPKAIKSDLESIAKAYDIPVDRLFSAIEKGDRKQLNEMLEAVGIIDRADTAQKILELQKIDSDRALAMKDTEATIKVLQDKRNSEVKDYVTKLVTERKTTLEKEVLPIIIDKECAELKLFDGDEGTKLRTEITAAIQKLNEQDLERMTAKDRAAMVASAFISKPLYLKVQSLSARIAELEGQLAKYDKAKPLVGGSTPNKTPVAEEKTFLQRARAGEI
jgi:hypothetical protein